MKQDLVEGDDFYFDDSGYMVLTKAYHLQRGDCCGNGCRHCPYNYINVPEPQRSLLFAAIKNTNSNLSNE